MPDEYDSSEIKVLKGLEAVRVRPEMYVGDLNANDLSTHLLFQTLCHAVDEIMDRKCTRIEIEVGSTKAKVWYDVGLPLRKDEEYFDYPAAMMFLALHAGCSNRKKHIEVGSEYCKLGLAVLNAFCRKLQATINDQGKHTTLVFEKGELMNTIAVENTKNSDSTEIVIELDSTILSSIFFDIDSIKLEALKLSEKFSVPVNVAEMC
ncbi:MAG: hypothetical protein ACRBHB_18685 [Arenicella sp.]